MVFALAGDSTTTSVLLICQLVLFIGKGAQG